MRSRFFSFLLLSAIACGLGSCGGQDAGSGYTLQDDNSDISARLEGLIQAVADLEAQLDKVIRQTTGENRTRIASIEAELTNVRTIAESLGNNNGRNLEARVAVLEQQVRQIGERLAGMTRPVNPPVEPMRIDFPCIIAQEPVVDDTNVQWTVTVRRYGSDVNMVYTYFYTKVWLGHDEILSKQFSDTAIGIYPWKIKENATKFYRDLKNFQSCPDTIHVRKRLVGSMRTDRQANFCYDFPPASSTVKTNKFFHRSVGVGIDGTTVTGTYTYRKVKAGGSENMTFSMSLHETSGYGNSVAKGIVAEVQRLIERHAHRQCDL